MSAMQSVSDIYEESRRYFMHEGILNSSLDRLVADLKSHEIDYVVIGALALLAQSARAAWQESDLGQRIKVFLRDKAFGGVPQVGPNLAATVAQFRGNSGRRR